MLHPLIKCVDRGVIQGKGLVAQGLIREGEVVSRLEPGEPTIPLAEFLTYPPEKQAEILVYGYQMREDLIVNEQGDEKYMNHSCDPNTWWADDDTMIARRDIQPGEEITYDYATTEVDIPFEMICLCGSPICRGKVTNRDYLDPEWQKRFGEHLPRHTLKAIARGEAK
ncbi:MAG: SET domain-containing protein-lysine N-methyltransferase [Phototrophicales bacterium]